ncbi:MAG: hypothetical protein U9N46_13340 [Euryarchaeota archaeon]|nr:hypothetical protein [Euryarchaeota archaeon]
MKAKTVVAAIAAILLVAVMAMPVVAEDTETMAEVTGAGSPPVIEEKF